MNIVTKLALLCCCSVFAGCSGGTGPEEVKTQSPLAVAAKTVWGRIGKKAPKPVDTRKVLTRAKIDAFKTPVLLMGLEDRDAYFTAAPIGENRGVSTWITGDYVTFSFKQGVLVATRGLGPDLMAADTRDVLPRLRGASGETVRVHDYLDGEAQTIRRSFYCTYDFQGQDKVNIYGIAYTLNLVQETCKNPDYAIENEYWLMPGTGHIRQSRQWIGPDAGYVFVQQITR